MRGFTLIELLVVMTILALAAIVVVINAPAARTDVRTSAERFALSLRIADDEAALSGRAMRLVIEENRYFFEQYGGGEWQAAPVGNFPAVVEMPNNVLLTATMESSVADNEARLLRPTQEKTDEKSQKMLIDPAGLPAVLTTEFAQNNNRWIVTRNERGEVSIERART